MPIARTEGTTIIEVREVDFDVLPPHKRYLWKPIVIEGDGPVEQRIVEADRVRVVRSNPSLDAVKTGLLDVVDHEFMAKTIVLPAVDRVRMRKREEAEDIIATVRDGGTPAAVDFPLLAASLLPGESLETGATRVFNAAVADDVSLARLETIRILAKAAIRAAATVAEAQAVHASIQWPGA